MRKNQGKRSVGSKDKVDTNKETNGQTDTTNRIYRTGYKSLTNAFDKC